MTKPALILASGTILTSGAILASRASAITSAERPLSPGSGRDLCIYCRTDKFVYWPPASRLLSADCPGCRRRGYR
jgi:hypothetical protein